jgi:polar amino acid transport system substrate-binding protein
MGPGDVSALGTLTALRLGCVDLDAPPLFGPISDGVRRGYEPEAAALVATAMGRTVEWVVLAWSEFYPALDERRVDAIWCGQGITPEREARADFTRPYAIFDESVVVPAGNPATSPADLAGLRIGAIEGSANMRTALTFDGIVPVGFPGTPDVFDDMIRALRSGQIDGFVDDDVVMVPLDAEPDLRLAFTVPTRLRWGIAVRRGDHALRAAFDAALGAVLADGSLRAVWERTMPALAFPLD